MFLAGMDIFSWWWVANPLFWWGIVALLCGEVDTAFWVNLIAVLCAASAMLFVGGSGYFLWMGSMGIAFVASVAAINKRFSERSLIEDSDGVSTSSIIP